MFFKKEKELKEYNSRNVRLYAPEMNEWREVLRLAMDGLVCINIGKLQGMEKQRFADRMAGGMYASGGYFHQLTDDVYLLMPGSVDFMEIGNATEYADDEDTEEEAQRI